MKSINATYSTPSETLQASMLNGTTAFDQGQCKIDEYPLSENTLNHLSYALMAMGLYQCFTNSFSTFKKAAKIISDVMHGKRPSAKDFSSITTAALGAACYVMIIMGVRGAIDYVESIEEMNGFDTRLLPQSSMLVALTIGTIILTLFGGSAMGTTAILNRAEKQLCNREIKTVDPEDIAPAMTVVGDIDLADYKAERYLQPYSYQTDV